MTEYSVSSKVEAAIKHHLANEEEGKGFVWLVVVYV